MRLNSHTIIAGLLALALLLMSATAQAAKSGRVALASSAVIEPLHGRIRPGRPGCGNGRPP
jgi:hypothetical protein